MYVYTKMFVKKFNETAGDLRVTHDKLLKHIKYFACCYCVLSFMFNKRAFNPFLQLHAMHCWFVLVELANIDLALNFFKRS